MMKMKKVKQPNNNIVRLEFDADFYVDRAIRATSRCQYDKALRYFRIAIDKDPENSYNYLNLAGLLAELGRFEESNDILEALLYDIAPTLFSCLYYLANNLISIGEFELAEEYLIKYMQCDPEGEYVEEAEELLHIIQSELGQVRSPKDPELEKLIHEEVKYFLKKGQPDKAREVLEELAATQVDIPQGSELQLVHSKSDPVLDCFLQQMNGYSREQRKDAKSLWMDFVINASHELIIRKAEAWAAAVEYTVLTNDGIPVTQKGVADKYAVSISSVNRNLRKLNGFLEKRRTQ